MEKKIIITAIICAFILISSCSISILMGDENLGNGYILWVEGKDGSSNCIIKSSNKPYKGSGIEIIPPTVINHNYNKKTIIVCSRDIETSQKLFWIIHKDKPINMDSCLGQVSCDSVLRSNIEGPMDSIQFYELKELRKMDLDF